MSILVSCACGKSYPIKEQFAGQRVQCPGCQRVLTVPGAAAPTQAAPAPKRSGLAKKAPPSEQVIDLPVADDASPSRQAGPRKRNSEFVFDLPAAEEETDLAPRSSGNLVLILALAFVVILGGGGTALYFILRDPDGGSPVVASNDKDGAKDARKDDKKPAKDEKGAVKTDTDKKDSDRKDRDKKDLEKKALDKKDPIEKVPVVPAGPWQGHSARILGVGFSKEGQVAFSAAGGEVLRDGVKAAAADSTVRLWEPSTGKELKRLDGFPHGLTAVAFDPTGALVVVADLGESFDLHVWDLAAKRELRALKGHEKPVLCAAFTPDGRRLLSGGKDAHLRVWDVESGVQIGDYPHSGFVNDVAVSNDGKLAVTACSDRTVRAFDLIDKKMLKEFPRHQDIVWSVAISPDGKYAASGGGGDYDATLGQFVDGSKDYEIRLWDVAAGLELRRLHGHLDQVRTLAFSADGRRLLSGAAGKNDKTVRLWHVASGRELGKFDAHTDWVQSVAFFPDGRRSLSGGYDKTLRVWTLPPDVGDLAKKLQEPGGDRLEMLREIGRYGPEAKEAVPILLKLLADTDPNVKRTAMETLGKVGTAGKEHLDLLMPLLKDAGFPEGRQFAVNALASMGRDALPALPEIIGLLKDTNPPVRLKAIGIIAAVGADAKSKAFKPLLELLRDPDVEVAKASADALTKLGKPTKSELPTLTGFLSDKGEPVRRYAVLAITDLGDDARDALPDVLKVLEKDEAVEIRMLALAALLKLQTEGKALVAPLTKVLADSDPKMNVKAAEALAALPPETPGVLPALLKAMEHADPLVVKTADDALEKYPFTKDHVKLMNDGLLSKNEGIRLRMLKAVAKLGADAAPAVPGLIDVAQKYTGEVRMTAVSVLGAIGPEAKDAGPVLAPLLKDGDRKARLAICLVLGKIGADEAKQAVPFLVGLLKVENLDDEEAKTARATAKETLIKIGEPAVDDLLKALSGDFAGGNPNLPIGQVKGFARLTALETLTDIGMKSKEPIRRALKPLADIQRSDPIPVIQQAAKLAYKAMQK